MAKRLPSILPPLTLSESLETTQIHSIAGKLGKNVSLISQRPFRSPHHTISQVALVGGGDGKPLAEMGLSDERWEEIKHHTVQGGSNIIKLRGRSSFQSPAYNAVKMIEAAMGGEKFTLPAGCYVNHDKLGFKNVMMAMPTTIDKTGVHFTEPAGTEEELASLQKSYEHLCKMRDEIVELGIVPPVAEWILASADFS